MPFLLAEILNFQGSTHLIGVGSLSQKITKLENDLVNHEGEINKEIVNNTDSLINQIAVVNGTIGVNWKELKGYKEGDDKKNRELCKLVSNAEKFDAEKTVDQANITSSESDFDINELGKSVLDYPGLDSRF